MQLHRSIRFSLTLWYTLTLAVIMLLFSSFVYVTVRAGIYKEADRSLLSVAEALASPTMEPFRRAAPAVFDQVLEDFFGSRIADKYVQLFDANGTVSAASKNISQNQLPLSLSAFQKVSAGKTVHDTIILNNFPPLRLVMIPVFEEGRLARVVQVGSSLGDDFAGLEKLLIIFSISIPLGLILLSAGGWFLAGQALEPVELITRSAQQISAKNLSQRLIVLNPNDEIGKLAETFNATLDRLENSFIRAKRFFTDISHELRTPLTIIRGEAEVGLKWAKEPEEFREILESTLDEVKHMSGIVESLLDLSRAEEGGLGLEFLDVDLNEFLEALCRDINQQRYAGQEGRVHFSPAAAQVRVSADQRRLRQIFVNLIDNALKFSPEGSEVRVSLGMKDAVARARVSDQGVGIPAEDIPNIFDRFYRVDKARNRGDGGSGLGLSLVRSLCEAHGGSVAVESSVGTGSTFIVSLPALS